jgi:hypothetical protein
MRSFSPQPRHIGIYRKAGWLDGRLYKSRRCIIPRTALRLAVIIALCLPAPTTRPTSTGGLGAAVVFLAGDGIGGRIIVLYWLVRRISQPDLHSSDHCASGSMCRSSMGGEPCHGQVGLDRPHGPPARPLPHTPHRALGASIPGRPIYSASRHESFCRLVCRSRALVSTYERSAGWSALASTREHRVLSAHERSALASARERS